jgi:hypothetical protein
LGRKEWKYLGLPAYVGRSRAKTFAYLKDRILKAIQGWKEKMLTKVGKEILIKACAQAIPVFAMTFFWAIQDKENKIHWLSWEKLTRSKEKRGLGYKDLYTFNLSMLPKQA